MERSLTPGDFVREEKKILEHSIKRAIEVFEGRTGMAIKRIHMEDPDTPIPKGAERTRYIHIKCEEEPYE
jgi:hypothetical protein